MTMNYGCWMSVPKGNGTQNPWRERRKQEIQAAALPPTTTTATARSYNRTCFAAFSVLPATCASLVALPLLLTLTGYFTPHQGGVDPPLRIHGMFHRIVFSHCGRADFWNPLQPQMDRFVTALVQACEVTDAAAVVASDNGFGHAYWTNMRKRRLQRVSVSEISDVFIHSLYLACGNAMKASELSSMSEKLVPCHYQCALEYVIQYYSFLTPTCLHPIYCFFSCHPFII